MNYRFIITIKNYRFISMNCKFFGEVEERERLDFAFS